MRFTYNEIKEAQDILVKYWGEDGKRVIETIFNIYTNHMTIKCFLDNCTACGGNWGGMLLSGIKRLYPDVWNVIPDNMGTHAWECICYTLMLLKIDTKGDE